MEYGADGGGLPERIGGYAVERELGAGGMGTVYLYAAEGPKHLRVVVHPHRGTAHPCLLAARRRSRLQEWLEDLPLILECFA